MSMPAPDQAVRNEALDTSQSFILEAPAGSGKTELLTARFIALLARVPHPRQILAVTFTRKASAEMADRITQVLKRVQEGREKPKNDWEILLNSLGEKAIERHKGHPELLKNPDTFQVGTFHSFCASITKAWPFEADLPPGSDILEDIEQDLTIEQAVGRYIDDLVSGRASSEETAAFEHRLASVNNSVRTLSGQLKDLLKRRDRLEDLAPLFTHPSAESIRSELDRRLEEYVSWYLSELPDYFVKHKGGWLSLKNALAEGGGTFGSIFPASVPGTSKKDISAWKSTAQVFLTTAGTPRKQLSGKGFPDGFGKHPSALFIKQLPNAVVRLLASVSKWPEPGDDNVGLESLADMVLLIGGVLSRFSQLLRERGLDYVELELATLRALRATDRPSESLIFYHDHLRHILVDEAQDLNDIQVKILGKLTEGWEPKDGRTVFLVGDPKQSIYRFRMAEVSLFYELQQRGLLRENESALPLKPLTITANFRSRPHLIAFANQLFEQVMASPREKYDEVKFACSEPARDESDRSSSVTAAVFYGREGDGKEVLSPLEREARWVAASVAKLHGERPEDTIAVLIPVRTCLSFYVEALNSFGVPVRLMEGIPLLDRPEVRHLLNLFTAMIRPYDDVVWAGALRAPWLYVPSQVLVNLKPVDGFWSKRILSTRDISQEVAMFTDAVEAARKMFGREPYASTLERLWEDLDGPGITASRYGAAGVSNVRKLLDLLGQCSGLPGEEALARLNRLLESAYTPPDPRGAFSKVFMMTIHKAKGLEFDHVFAVNLNYNPLSGGRGEQPAYRVERLPGKERHLLIAAMGDRRTGEDNLAFFLLKDLQKQRALAEARRLFYVVGTRARESLALTGCIRKSPEETDAEGDFKIPLEWLLKAHANGTLTLTEFLLLSNPTPPEIPGVVKKAAFPSLTPPPFEAEPLPYRIVSPSRVEDETSLAVAPGAEEEDEDARARGVVIHRILDTFARGGNQPDLQAIIAALTEEGISPDDASGMANDILKESNSAWETPEFKNLCRSATDLHSEWAIEDYDGEYSLRVGRVDLLVQTDNQWTIIDYKTGRPEGDMEAWVKEQMLHYRSQLSAYAQMVARVMNVPEEKVTWTILFTALPLLVRQRE